jgi:acyl carrier protein
VTILSEADVAMRVITLCASLTESHGIISMDMSLTQALAFDSLKLMQFFAGIEQLYPGVALEDWFIETSTDGRDTVRSAVTYLTRFLDLGIVRG